MLIAGGQQDIDTLFLQLLPDPLELLVFADFHRLVVARTLQLTRRILHVRFHQIRDRLVERDQRPGALHEIVHEDVIALLRVLPRSSIS